MNEKISAQVMSSINDAYKKGTPELKGLSPLMATRPTFLDGAKTAGLRDYELTDHLSNVMAVISDRKFSVDTNYDNITDYYAPQVVSFTDYYPFGFPMAERSGNLAGYRFGFNGQEADNEVYGTKQSYSFEFRNYDARLGRFWSVDPLASEYPSLSPYAYCANNPIIYIDIDGQKITFGFLAFRERRLFNRVYRSADAETRAKYDALKSSNVNYRINITNLSDRAGETTYNFEKDRVDININPNSNNMIGTIGDELETAHQYEVGDIGFVLGNNGVVGTLGYDMNDEVATKRAEIKATEAVNNFEGKNIQLDKTTQAFKLADEGPITLGMTRDQMIENYFKTDASAKQYLNVFQPAIPGLHTGGANMQNKISGTGGYTIQQLEAAKQQGTIKDFKYNGQ